MNQSDLFRQASEAYFLMEGADPQRQLSFRNSFVALVEASALLAKADPLLLQAAIVKRSVKYRQFREVGFDEREAFDLAGASSPK